MTLRLDVAVAAPPDEVAARLDAAASDPATVVRWFTSDPAVRAVVARSSRGWDLSVIGPAFTADCGITVATAPSGPGPSPAPGSGSRQGAGSTILLDGEIAGRGMFRLATPALGVARSRIEATARDTLLREFGRPGSRRS